MKPNLFARLIAAGAIVAGTLGALPAQAAGISGLFVFGDSLSDAGNNALAGLIDPTQTITGNSYIPSSSYAAGTYSNGPVWASYLASTLGLPPLLPSLAGGTDFAFGGATTGTPGAGAGGFPYDLRVQAAQYLGATGNVASPDALYVIAGGGNNARAALTAIGGGADLFATAAATAASFADDIGDIVDELQAAGARHILVWNAPNLAVGPAVAAGGPGAIAAGSFLSTAMNDALAARLASEPYVTTFDLYGFGTQLSTDPAAFGLTNGSDACGAVAGADCSQYVYWDGVHPTTAAHALLADAVNITLQVPEPQTYALLAAGLFFVALRARRTQRRAVAA